MGYVFTPPLNRFAEFCARDLKLEMFVETGTHLGGSAAWAADHFSLVKTVEWDSQLFAKSRARLASFGNVECVQGDSVEWLRSWCPLPQPKLFWLDAHWTGIGDPPRENQCPLLRELDALLSSVTDDVILIDDFHMFATPPAPPFDGRQWPTLGNIAQSCEELFVFGNALICPKNGVVDRVRTWLREESHLTAR
jgi:hypothetical protein